MGMPRASSARLLGALRRLVMALCALVLCALAPGPAAAQNIESVLRPGDLIRGHAKWENDCAQCHIKFDRAAQDRLCMDCHKPVGEDMRTRGGFHGRLKPQPCRACHTDHKGREARVAEFDRQHFDHAQTDWALRGKHRSTDCAKCHAPARKFREAPHDCAACHGKDDTHRGSLGKACGDCHTESDWKEARFDHAATRFTLTGRHTEAKCGDCHRTERYKETPRTCIGCHRKDDDGAKGHRGRFGEKCESCHGTKAWKPTTFNHDADTRFQLRGKHRGAACGACHTGRLLRDKTGSACVDCHTRDDKHKGSLGRDCGACHTERDWKEGARFDHERTVFPLRGRHREASCESCHRGGNYKAARSDCVSCHRKDDRHEGNLGAACGDCHNDRDWKTTPAFDHGRTRFPLANGHRGPKATCAACHVDLRHYRDTPLACVSCHRKDDRHEGSQGQACERCHDDRDWKAARFDHRQARFQLLGRHAVVKCDKCHETRRYTDTPRDCYACHKADDRHKLVYGKACESCHNARGWGLWAFDHAKATRFALDGAHAKSACAACHTRPAPEGRKAFAVDTACVNCHRREDVHDGSYGATCERCHATDSWKRIRQRFGAVQRPGPERVVWREGDRP